MKSRLLPLVLALSLALPGCGDAPSMTRVSPDSAPVGERGDEGGGAAGSGCVVDRGPRVARYRVQRGDTLSGIAREVYGDASLWPEIVRANPSVAGRDAVIRAGDELIIPFEGR